MGRRMTVARNHFKRLIGKRKKDLKKRKSRGEKNPVSIVFRFKMFFNNLGKEEIKKRL